MKACGALLVLLCCCLAETQLRGETISDNDISHQGLDDEAETRDNEVMDEAQRTEDAATACTQQTCQPDIHTVLREMSALVAEQRVELRHTKTQMEAMESRLRASEQTVEEQRVELRQTEARLTASEKQVEQLQTEHEVKLNLTASQVEELRRERDERRVSFSASLLTSGSGHTGPFSAEMPLVFRHIFTNIGNYYNSNTGIFTAPVRGVYHFVVFIHGGGHASRPSAVNLYKNGECFLSAYSHQPVGEVKPSNGASLLLEVGDVVYVKLRANTWVFDNSLYHHTTFSGHLLFPM